MHESPQVTKNDIFVGKFDYLHDKKLHKKDAGRIRDKNVAHAAAMKIKKVFEKRDQGRTDDEKRFFSNEMTESMLLTTAENLITDEKFQESEKRAVKDPMLDKLYNRRFFEETLSVHLAQYKRDRIPCAVVLGDLEDLKITNDTYGHAAGDKKLFAMQDGFVNGGFREGDVKCRIGGDETGIIMPKVIAIKQGITLSPIDIAADATLRVAENICNRDIKFGPKDEITMHAIVDFGITTITDNDKVASVKERSDRAAYIAKHLHKNTNRILSAVTVVLEHGLEVYDLVYFDDSRKIVHERIQDAAKILRSKAKK